MHRNAVTGFGDFLKAHNRSAKILGGMAFLPPLVSLLPAEWAAYIFPPIGDFAATAKCGVLIFAIGAIFCAYLLISARHLRAIIIGSLLISLCSFVLYISLLSRFTRKVDIPSQKSSVFVTVGYERTDYAKKNFSSDSDWEMLRARSLLEEEIENLWTGRSLQVARTLLLTSYLGVILGWVFAFSCVIAYDLSKGSTTATTT